MMNVLSVPVVCSTFTCLPARSRIHCLPSSQPLLRSLQTRVKPRVSDVAGSSPLSKDQHGEVAHRSPALPRRLMSWSGLTTSLSVKTQDGSAESGVIWPVAASHETLKTNNKIQVSTARARVGAPSDLGDELGRRSSGVGEGSRSAHLSDTRIGRLEPRPD